MGNVHRRSGESLGKVQGESGEGSGRVLGRSREIPGRSVESLGKVLGESEIGQERIRGRSRESLGKVWGKSREFVVGFSAAFFVGFLQDSREIDLRHKILDSETSTGPNLTNYTLFESS